MRKLEDAIKLLHNVVVVNVTVTVIDQTALDSIIAVQELEASLISPFNSTGD